MIVTALIFLMVGGILLWFGRYFAGGDISLLQEYHRSRVSPEAVAILGRKVASGMYHIAVGLIVLAGFLAATAVTGREEFLWPGYGLFALSFAGGLVLTLSAVKKYNHGIF